MDGADLAAAGGDLPMVGVAMVVISCFLFAVALLALVIPAVVFLAELVFVAVVVGVGLVSRILFGMPWTVEARQPDLGQVLEWKVVGWAASNEAVRSIAGQLQADGTAKVGVR